MRPPITLNPKILNLATELGRLLGRYEGLHAPVPQPELRRQNRIKTIQGSVAIEGNTLSLEQVTSLFGSKRVLGPPKDILEVQNAIRLYDSLHEFNPRSLQDFLKAHGFLMKGLAPDAGRLRTGAVGILHGSKVSHVAPPARQIPRRVGELFDFLKNEKELSPLIQACIFHYELEFIHPFSDGNGRMGRFWQTLILTHYNPAFEYLPVESVIRQRQKAYYEALAKSDKQGECTVFVEFAMAVIRDALQEFLDQLKPMVETTESRLSLAEKHFGEREFTRKDYLAFFKTISTATASRDLASGVRIKTLKRSGQKALSRYQFQSRER
jgi:Fic family protein